MSDDADQAQEKMEIDLAHAIRMASAAPLIRGTGRCLYCDEPVGEGVRWCSIPCRDDYQKDAGVK